MGVQNPWTKRSEKIVYKNPWITVREDQVIRPDGTPGIYGVIDTALCTGVVALTPANEVYLIGQFRYATETYSWEIVAGGAHAGEDGIDAAKRELREEAGLEAARWSALGGEIHISNCVSSEKAALFLAEDLKEVPKNPDPTEILTVRKEPLSRCVEMVRQGEIQDAVSMIAIMLVDARLKEAQSR